MTALRTITSCTGTALGHWRLDQISSVPEVIFMVTCPAATRQVQASAVAVRSSRVTVTGRPATASSTVGVITMSESSQGPSG